MRVDDLFITEDVSVMDAMRKLDETGLGVLFVAPDGLLRAVIKLQRVLRDVDPAGRIDTADFALLLKGMSSRQALTERMVTLIASGLIPLPNLVPEVTLQFQVSCVLLQENPVPADRVLGDLQGLLAGMSPRTRRPIRFLEALPTEASEVSDEDLTQAGVPL